MNAADVAPQKRNDVDSFRIGKWFADTSMRAATALADQISDLDLFATKIGQNDNKQDFGDEHSVPMNMGVR